MAIKDSEVSDKAPIESDERYRVLFETANDAIFIMQGEKFIECNRKTLELFGCTKSQIIGATPLSMTSLSASLLK